ncbi:MAG: endonuclease/exonuclease/phosphatase family protein [Flavobacteriaceae bacterium]|nr:endonuclease/exonuclease/phosphatase family protein [Flavobacteriaceae bacterium]
MKIASYNIQNLFHRHKSFRDHSLSHNVKQWVAELDDLIMRADKSPNDLDRVRELSFLLGFDQVNMHQYGTLRTRNGELYLKQGVQGRESKAGNNDLWNGWLALQTVPVPVRAQQHKAKTILEIGPDILLLQEVEDAASLVEFHGRVLKSPDALTEPEIHVFEGNEAKGRNLGVLLRNGYRLQGFVTHRYVRSAKGRLLFPLDCQEYHIASASGERVVFLLAQFSKASEQDRREQSQTLAHIYKGLQERGHQNIVVCGTFYEPSFSDTLSPLLRETDLHSASRHPEFIADKDLDGHAHYHSMTAYRKGVNLKQQDYLLVSPSLWERTIGAGLHRKGIWPGNQGKWPVYPTMQKAGHAASEHPLIWMEVKP